MNVRARKRMTAWLAVATVAGMVAMSFAAVPLYREFCQLTGFAGTPRRPIVRCYLVKGNCTSPSRYCSGYSTTCLPPVKN